MKIFTFILLIIIGTTTQAANVTNLVAGDSVVVGDLWSAIPSASGGGGGANTILDDAFSRTGNLDGSTPSPIGATNWAHWYGDPWLITTSSGLATFSSMSCAVANNITISSNKIYTLTTTINVAPGSDGWMMAGFNGRSAAAPLFCGGPWVLINADGGVAAFWNGLDSSMTISGTANLAGSNNVVKLIYDVNTLGAQVWINNVEFGSATCTGIDQPTNVVVGAYTSSSSNNGTMGEFKVTEQ